MDLEKLLAPVSEDSPTGVNLRDQPADLTFQQLEEERSEVSPEEDPSGSGHTPQWPKIVAACEEKFAETKDLQLAVWLTEATARVEGFDGLAAGLRLLTKLMETYWEGLHPGADPEDGVVLPIRAKPLNWIGSSRDFLDSVAHCPILTGGERPLGWYDYKHTELLDTKKGLSDSSQYQGLKDLGFIDGDEWNARLGSQSPSDLQAVLTSVNGCQEALEEMRALCDKQFGSDEAPILVGLGEYFYDLREYLTDRIPDDVAEESADGAVAGAAEGGGGGGAGGPAQNRQQALQKLNEAADYFRRSEPHSPISYLVERAVRWGGMPLMEVLAECVEDPSALQRIQLNLGIRSSESEGG